MKKLLTIGIMLGTIHLSVSWAGEEEGGFQRLSSGVIKDFHKEADQLAAIQDLEGTDPGWSAVRELKTKLYLRLLDRMDGMRDLKFNFDDSPPQNDSPPGFRYPSGTSPEAVTDPKERAEYEAFLKQSDEKASHFNYELSLKRLDELVTIQAAAFLNWAYKKTPEDARTLTDDLQLLTNAAHRVQMQEKVHEILVVSKS